MNNLKQNFFRTKNNQKIHYKFINNKSLTTIIFLHGLMSDIKSKKAKHENTNPDSLSTNALFVVDNNILTELFNYRVE